MATVETVRWSTTVDPWVTVGWTTTGSTTTAAWDTWTTTSTGTYTITNGSGDQVLRYWAEEDRRTAEQRQADADRAQRGREEASRQRLAREVQREGAQERAMELLTSLLTPEEADWLDRNEDIRVVGSEGGIYHIGLTTGVHGNIAATDEHGCRLGRLCVAPQMRDARGMALPLGDGWVGQYLAIKHNEEALLAKANWSGRMPCRRGQVIPLAA